MSVNIEAVTTPVTLGEGPHWDSDEQVLYFISVSDYTIHKYVPATGEQTSSKLDEMPSFMIPVEGKKNHFLVGQYRKVVEIEWSGEMNSAKVVRTVTELDQDNGKNKFNDAKADPRGRLFAGTMGTESEPGKLHRKMGYMYRIDHDGTRHQLCDNIDISNGLCWDVNEKAFYFADSFEYTIRRYDYDVETGDISNLKTIFKLEDHEFDGIIDGMTIDTDGNLWVANFLGQRILKIDPRTGNLLQEVSMPVPYVSSLAFGGPNLDILYVTSAKMNLGKEQTPLCGSTFKITGLGVKGHPAVNVKLD